VGARNTDDAPIAVAEPKPLYTIVVAARKGGSGKSTVALHLALAAHLRGHKVLLADTDSQRSSTESLDAREVDKLNCVPTTGSTLSWLKSRARTDGIRYLIVDTPGGPGPDLAHAMMVSDLNLLIARPSFLDIAAAAHTFNEARTMNAPSIILLNQAPPARGGEESTEVVKALEALKYTRLPASPVVLHARAAYQKAAAVGRSVEELGRSPAADEIAALWNHVETLLADKPAVEFVDTALALLREGPPQLQTSEPGALSP
jgi:chromosome partitioning protein